MKIHNCHTRIFTNKIELRLIIDTVKARRWKFNVFDNA